jgi:selenocysteine lyase/cysteine desulfurase
VHGKLHDAAENLRRNFADFIGADSDSVAAVASTSAGISTVAMGLDWRPGDNVVVPEIDFPSLVFPWMILADRGVQLRRVPCKQGRVEIEQLLGATDARTRVIGTSWVQFSSGFRTDLAELGEACRRKDILLVIDGMHGIGALLLEVSSLPVDVVATQSYKWLLSPQGVGWM